MDSKQPTHVLRVHLTTFEDVRDVLFALFQAGEKTVPAEFSTVYRGQSSKWSEIQPTADRPKNTISFTSLLPTRFDIRAATTHYQRRIHNVTKNLPRPDDWLGWAALIQHYGGPTKLVDVTDSPYVALYFAATRRDGSEEGDLWCIRRSLKLDSGVFQPHLKAIKKLVSSGESKYASRSYILAGHEVATSMQTGRGIGRRLLHYLQDQEGYIDLVGQPRLSRREERDLRRVRHVMIVRPFYLNPRMLAQQGRFAVAINHGDQVAESFMSHLSSGSGKTLVEKWIKPNEFKAALGKWFRVARVSISDGALKQSLSWLRSLNITGQSLFPDFHGWTEAMAEVQREPRYEDL